MGFYIFLSIFSLAIAMKSRLTCDSDVKDLAPNLSLVLFSKLDK